MFKWTLVLGSLAGSDTQFAWSLSEHYRGTKVNKRIISAIILSPLLIIFLINTAIAQIFPDQNRQGLRGIQNFNVRIFWMLKTPNQEWIDLG